MGFQIEPGEPVLVTRSDVAVQGPGADLAVFASVIESSAIVIGERLQHDAYEATKSRLLVAAHEYGFFEARLLASEIRV